MEGETKENDNGARRIRNHLPREYGVQQKRLEVNQRSEDKWLKLSRYLAYIWSGGGMACRDPFPVLEETSVSLLIQKPG